MKLKLDMSCHLLNAYTKFQIDISKHLEKKSGKLGRTDGRTDGQTDGHCHSIIRPFFKRAYNNSNAMVIGSKWQLKSLNLDDFTISVGSDKLFLARQARYWGLWVRNDLSWDNRILELCRKMYYYFHMFRRFRKILPSVYFSKYITPMYNQR